MIKNIIKLYEKIVYKELIFYFFFFIDFIRLDVCLIKNININIRNFFILIYYNLFIFFENKKKILVNKENYKYHFIYFLNIL